MRTRDFRRRNREDAVREYFYGIKPNLLSPFSFDLAFSEVLICKIGGEMATASGVLHLPWSPSLPQLRPCLSLPCLWGWRKLMEVFSSSMKSLVSTSSLPFSLLSSSSSLCPTIHHSPLSPHSAKQLSHTIVSLSMATSTEEDVASTPSAGFLCM